MAGHAQLKFVITESSKKQIRLIGLISLTADKLDSVGKHNRIKTQWLRLDIHIVPDQILVQTK